MDVYRLVARNIRRLRLERGISQEDLAHRAGLDRSYVSALDRGRRNPSLRVLHQVAVALDVSLVDIVSEHTAQDTLPPELPRGPRPR